MIRLSFLFFLAFICISYSSDTIVVSDSLFDFKMVRIDTTGYRSEIKEIIVSSRLSNTEIQRILLPHNKGFMKSTALESYIPDVNFDGYSDISVLEECYAGPNCGHIFYVYDKKSETFIRDSVLERLSSPEFLPETKTIRSFFTSGCCYHGENLYKYYNNQIVCIVQRLCEPYASKEFHGYISTVYKMRKGKMLLVKKMYLTKEYVCNVGFGW